MDSVTAFGMDSVTAFGMDSVTASNLILVTSTICFQGEFQLEVAGSLILAPVGLMTCPTTSYGTYLALRLPGRK